MVPRLQESCPLTPSGPRARVHATKESFFSRSLHFDLGRKRVCVSLSLSLPYNHHKRAQPCVYPRSIHLPRPPNQRSLPTRHSVRQGNNLFSIDLAIMAYLDSAGLIPPRSTDLNNFNSSMREEHGESYVQSIPKKRFTRFPLSSLPYSTC